MKDHPSKPELLAPAGNFEKLEIAVHYGADAVYLAGKNFSLRNFSGNFTRDELKSAVKFAHASNLKIYLACNIYSRNFEQNDIENYLEFVGKTGVDAVIISDPGILHMAKTLIPQIDIHLSTQANTTNLSAVKFWKSLGIKRVNLARELTLEEIRQISNASVLETETFIHGAMCISCSGRCLLSNFLSGRDSNRGLCSHPCRWKYSVVEEFRPNEYHPLMEDEKGAYIFNSKDLCMIEHIPALIEANITSLKIEGRMKGIHYLASVVKTYRQAIDAYISNPEAYALDPDWLSEINHVFHREYCTGFYFNSPDAQLSNIHNLHKGKIHSFIGKILRCVDPARYEVEIRNKICPGDKIEILSIAGKPRQSVVAELSDLDGVPLDAAHPNTNAMLKLDIQCHPNDIVRKI